HSLASIGQIVDFISMVRRPPGATRFPYTPLFRSLVGIHRRQQWVGNVAFGTAEQADQPAVTVMLQQQTYGCGDQCGRNQAQRTRSEEHTSELQSRENLVCRLLLEKKKTEQHWRRQ